VRRFQAVSQETDRACDLSRGAAGIRQLTSDHLEQNHAEAEDVGSLGALLISQDLRCRPIEFFFVVLAEFFATVAIHLLVFQVIDSVALR